MKLANLWWAMAAVVLAACSTGAAPTNAPTQALIPAPPTPTATLFVATDTPPPILAPADVTVPQVTAVAEELQPLVQEIVSDLASLLRIEAETIQVVRVESAFWTTEGFGCDLENAEVEERGTGYQVVLFADNRFYEYHTDDEGQFLRCEEVNPTAAATLAVGIMLEFDPVAAELVALAQQRIADELDLPIRRVRVLVVQPMLWTDSSLGCPQPDQTYRQVETDGYRIVVGVAEETYIFHSDFDRLLPCEADNEQLPES